MPELFDEFNKIFKKDFVPILVKYFKDPNNKVSENINDFLNDPKMFVTDIFEKFTKKKDIDIEEENDINIKPIIDIESSLDDEYDDLLKRLIVIEENMIQLEKILKDKN